MFTNYTNPFGFNPSFNGFQTPFNQFAGFAPAWQPNGWYTPGYQTPSFQAPINFGYNGFNTGFGLNGQFCAPGCCPDFSYNNAWSPATPYAGYAPSFAPGAWAATPFAGFQNPQYATPWQGYTAQASTGWNGSYAPTTNPWNYAGTTGSYNGVNAQTVPGGFPVTGGVCRNAA